MTLVYGIIAGAAVVLLWIIYEIRKGGDWQWK
jgi:hypothetical protein